MEEFSEKVFIDTKGICCQCLLIKMTQSSTCRLARYWFAFIKARQCDRLILYISVS